jgi:hypothetical protein
LGDAERKSGLFSKAFDTEVELVWRPARVHARVASGPRLMAAG